MYSNANVLFLLFIGPILPPTTAQPLQPMSSKPNTPLDKQDVKNNKPQMVGATWSNSGSLNIDLDNLLVAKQNKGAAPSMNQLASNPTSPVNQSRLNAQNNNQFFATFK